MRTYRDSNPRIIEARFTSKCGETGKEILKGETCVYYPLAKQVFHVNSRTYELFLSEQFDREWLGREY